MYDQAREGPLLFRPDLWWRETLCAGTGEQEQVVLCQAGWAVESDGALFAFELFRSIELQL